MARAGDWLLKAVAVSVQVFARLRQRQTPQKEEQLGVSSNYDFAPIALNEAR
jgi:hypothetical protein